MVVENANRSSDMVIVLPSFANRQITSPPVESPRHSQSTQVGVVIRDAMNGICGKRSCGVHSFQEDANNNSANPAMPRV